MSCVKIVPEDNVDIEDILLVVFNNNLLPGLENCTKALCTKGRWLGWLFCLNNKNKWKPCRFPTEVDMSYIVRDDIFSQTIIDYIIQSISK